MAMKKPKKKPKVVKKKQVLPKFEIQKRKDALFCDADKITSYELMPPFANV